MAKKKSQDELNINDYDAEGTGGNKAVSIIIGIIIVIIWLAIFALLIKMNVGGIGSMLRPYLKDVPVLNIILPAKTDDEVAQETGYQSLAEAVDRIHELEAELEMYQSNGSADSDTIAEMKAEIARLHVFEENALYYQDLKDKFDEDVVYTENAPDITNYKEWYESMDPDNAAKIYERVLRDIAYSDAVKDWADTFTQMDPGKASAILEEMTGDTDLVAKILLSMTSAQRAAIMARMDPIYAAKLTKIMYP
ncbi:MAG: MotE family protein [Lachnospira sp.]